jgi:hypothetical protein
MDNAQMPVANVDRSVMLNFISITAVPFESIRFPSGQGFDSSARRWSGRLLRKNQCHPKLMVGSGESPETLQTLVTSPVHAGLSNHGHLRARQHSTSDRVTSTTVVPSIHVNAHPYD